MESVHNFVSSMIAEGKNVRDVIALGARKKFRPVEIMAAMQKQVADNSREKYKNTMEEEEEISSDEEVIASSSSHMQEEAQEKKGTSLIFGSTTISMDGEDNKGDPEDVNWEHEDDWGEDGDEWGDDKDEWGEGENGELMSAPTMTRSSSFKIHDSSEVQRNLDGVILKVSELLYVSADMAGCLLRHYRWDDTKLKHEWFEDQMKVKAKVGLIDAKAQGTSTPNEVQCLSWGHGKVPIRKAHALSCGHFFCKSCWRKFLESEVENGRTCIFARCPALRCNKQHVHKFGCTCTELVPSSTFKKYLKKAHLMKKYNDWNLQSFVEGQEGLKWCPNPKCTRVVEYKQGGERTIECQCSHSFCFSCLRPEHEPAPCDLVTKWLESTAVSDDATELWLKARTKTCPKCQVRIEKNRACNHMHCTKCNHHFCWLCKGPWSKHGTSTGGFYVCKKYQEDLKKGDRSNEEKDMITTQQMLQKYQYYVGRFNDAKNGVMLTRKLERKLDQQFTKQNRSVEHTKFITDATTSLAHARTCMQWCYVLDFYLVAGKEKKLFEFQQELLIDHTEQLQELVETNTVETLLASKKEILSKTTTLNNLRRRMIRIVKEGNFEAVLSYKGDSKSENWQCLFCETSNKITYAFCKNCQACKLHGEPDCRACSNSRTT